MYGDGTGADVNQLTQPVTPPHDFSDGDDGGGDNAINDSIPQGDTSAFKDFEDEDDGDASTSKQFYVSFSKNTPTEDLLVFPDFVPISVYPANDGDESRDIGCAGANVPHVEASTQHVNPIVLEVPVDPSVASVDEAVHHTELPSDKPGDAPSTGDIVCEEHHDTNASAHLEEEFTQLSGECSFLCKTNLSVCWIYELKYPFF